MFYISLKKSWIPWFCDYEILTFLSITFIYKPILLKISLNANIVKTQIFHKFFSKVIQGHKQWPFLFKINFFFCLCYWLIGETKTAEHYKRTKFDLYKDDICLVLTLTYVLMDNFFLLKLCLKKKYTFY